MQLQVLQLLHHLARKLLVNLLGFEVQHLILLLSKQLLKSSTSIGANLEEAIGGFSKKDFHYKISISYKEARETRYWLKLLVASDLIHIEEGNQLLDELEEILKILGRTIITLNQKNSA